MPPAPIELQDLGVQKVMLEQSDDLELDLTTWIIPIVLAFVLALIKTESFGTSEKYMSARI